MPIIIYPFFNDSSYNQKTMNIQFGPATFISVALFWDKQACFQSSVIYVSESGTAYFNSPVLVWK